MIVDVTMCDRINDQLTIGFNTYSSYSERLEDFIIERGGNMGRGAKVSHLFRYNSEIFQRALFYRNRTDKDWLLDRVISKNMIDGAGALEDYTIDLEPDSTAPTYLLDHLKALITTAQQKGTKVKLVINPYYPPFAKTIKNMAAFKSAIESYSQLVVNSITHRHINNHL